MNPKNSKKSPIHENADANITCDFGDGDISRSRSFLSNRYRRERRPDDPEDGQSRGLLKFNSRFCVAVTRHDFCVTPSRLIEGTAARPSYDSHANCVTDPRLAHDRHGIIILIHDRRTTPSRRFQDLCVTLLGYIKS